MEERKKAEMVYEDAVASGDQMAVLATYTREKHSRRMISCLLGNFPSGTKAILTCFMTAKIQAECG